MLRSRVLSFSIKNECKKSKGIQASTVDHGNDKASDHRALVVKLRLK